MEQIKATGLLSANTHHVQIVPPNLFGTSQLTLQFQDRVLALTDYMAIADPIINYSPLLFIASFMAFKENCDPHGQQIHVCVSD